MKVKGIQMIKEKYEQQLLKLAHVVGVGIGNKVVNNIVTNRPCLKVYVQKKVALNSLAQADIIPKKLDTIETDVEEIGRLKAQ